MMKITTTAAAVVSLISLSESTATAALWIFCLLLLDYAGVLMAIIVDLYSGLLKAKRSGEARTSVGYRRSVDKALRYFLFLMVLTIIDAMVVCALMLLRATSGCNVPPLPIFTTFGALCLCIIEAKSVMENTGSDSVLSSVVDMACKAMDNKKVRRLADAVRKQTKDR